MHVPLESANITCEPTRATRNPRMACSSVVCCPEVQLPASDMYPYVGWLSDSIIHPLTVQEAVRALLVTVYRYDQRPEPEGTWGPVDGSLSQLAMPSQIAMGIAKHETRRART